MQGLPLPLIQSYRPRSFAERGLAAPFTTPMLSGARLRLAPCATPQPSERILLRRGVRNQDASNRLKSVALEIVVPNPSGGRGVYILPWGEISGLCRPTLHDVMLGQMLGAMLDQGIGPLTPALMQEAARETATKGPAGRPAARHADDQVRRHAERLLKTRFLLLVDTTEQIERRLGRTPNLLMQRTVDIEQRSRLALTTLAETVGQPAQAMADLLDGLAVCYVDIGMVEPLADTPAVGLLASLEALQSELTIWAQTTSSMHSERAQGTTRDAQRILTAADLTTHMARVLLHKARTPLQDLPALMRAALADPRDVAERCERAAWVLDGWDRICRLWHDSADAPPHNAPPRDAPPRDASARHAAVQEMASLVPPLPDEAEQWLQLPAGTADRLSQRPGAAQADPHDTLMRDTPAPFDRITRNERLLAQAD